MWGGGVRPWLALAENASNLLMTLSLERDRQEMLLRGTPQPHQDLSHLRCDHLRPFPLELLVEKLPNRGEDL